MKQLYLKCQYESEEIKEEIELREKEKNYYVEFFKRAKKSKNSEKADRYKQRKEIAEKEINDLREKRIALEKEFDRLRHLCGKLRLDLYVFADILYGTLVEYEQFLNSYVINKDGDKDVTDAVSTAINAIKKLPYEMAEGGYTNDLYCAVTEKFMDRWQQIRDGVIIEVLRELDKEFTN